jgi:glutathione synthase
MKVALLVNRVETEIAEYTTTRLALAAARAGHTVWYVGVGDVNHEERLSAHAHRATGSEEDTLKDFLRRASSEDRVERIMLDELDLLVLRNDSIEDLHERPWAQNLGIVFGQRAAAAGVVVVNDPLRLPRASSKLYLQEFPREVRPTSLISRNRDEIKEFIQRSGDVVLKPLYGAKGRNVFLVREDEGPNLNQIIDTVLEDGYALAQEYLAEAEQGDTRLFLIAGEPLQLDGTYAAFSRMPADDDLRSNISTGGQPEPATIGDAELGIARALRDRLIEDGMFLVAIDIVGSKVVEINAESPGGLQSVEGLTGVDFGPVIVDALERRCNKRMG